MISTKQLTPKEIGKEVSAYLKVNRITQKEAAQRLGLASKQGVANLLSGKRFSVPMAAKFAHEFGIRKEFLLYGEGPMTDGSTCPRREQTEEREDELRALRETIRIQADTIAFLTARLQALMDGAKASPSRKYLRYIVSSEAGETTTEDYREAFTLYQRTYGGKALKGLKPDGELKTIFKKDNIKH